MSGGIAVIFVLDGLLADTEPLWSESARELLRRRGRAYDPSLKSSFIGRHPVEVIERMIAHYGLDGEDPATLLQERLSILEQLYSSGEIRAMPGAPELVTALEEEEVPMAVASGSPASLVRLVLERLSLSDRLPVQVGSDAVARGKPAPDLFLLAARRLGVAPIRCVVLEDAPAGLEAGLAAGMTVIVVPGPDTPFEALSRAHVAASSLTDITPALLARVVNARTP